MPGDPGFFVRSYPAFRPARLYRVVVRKGTFYFFRMKGLVSASDAGHDRMFRPGGERIFAALISKFAAWQVNSSMSEIEGRDPEEVVHSNRKHFKVLASDVSSSSLDPPSLFSGRPVSGRWKLVTPALKITYEIEDDDSLRTALAALPAALGPRLAVKVKPPTP